MTRAINGLGHPPRLICKVDRETITAAARENSNACMVAETIKKAKPRLQYIAVDIQTVRATDPKKGERYIWLTPRSIQQKIIDFDKGKRVEPFSFRLDDGQTIPSGRNPSWKKKTSTKAKLRKSATKRARTSVPVKVGGKAPPKAIGSRRAFGLRALAY